jgi:hypothetical protein
MTLRARPPRAVWTVGLATLAPVVAAAGVFCYGPAEAQPWGFRALLIFSAVLLAYLGGIRAGWEIQKPAPRWSVTGLSLLAPAGAGGLVLIAPLLSEALLIGALLAGHIAQWAWDATTSEGPDWRPRMRTLLTAGAALSLAFALEQALHI